MLEIDQICAPDITSTPLVPRKMFIKKKDREQAFSHTRLFSEVCVNLFHRDTAFKTQSLDSTILSSNIYNFRTQTLWNCHV